jgi:cyclohexadienyl dehydratase
MDLAGLMGLAARLRLATRDDGGSGLVARAGASFMDLAARLRLATREWCFGLAVLLVGAMSAAGVAVAESVPALPKVIRIGTSGDYAPFSVERDGVRAGFDVELAERFASEAGFRIEWVTFRWPALSADVAADRFDVAMSGVTAIPERAGVGYLTRAVATSGPCVLGSAAPKRVAVNRGGALERWARQHFDGAEIRTVDRNQSLPELLARGEVDAIVTDRFEKRHFKQTEWSERCEAPVDRKVFWVAPARVGDLGPRFDAWLARNEAQVDAARVRWLGASARRTDTDHLLDLIARRLALMPAVARAKAARGLPIEDPEREAKVVAGVRARARAAGLDAATVESLFRLQIELSRRVQQSDAKARDAAPDLDLDRALRPAIGGLGDRIVSALAEQAPISAASLDAADWAPIAVWLSEPERFALRDALLAVRRAPNGSLH